MVVDMGVDMVVDVVVDVNVMVVVCQCGGGGCGGDRGGNGGACGGAHSRHCDESRRMDLDPINETGIGRQKSALSTLKGTRKVWGTLRSTSSVAVSNALKLVPKTTVM